jgi:ABC-type amino acid transport substrate-binding protein
MKKRLITLVLALCMVLTLCGCGKTGGAYKQIDVLSEGKYAIGFRNDDPIADYVEAALKVLASSGRVAELEARWFSDTGFTSFPKDGDALTKLGEIPHRSLIMGLDPDNFPMSYVSNGVYMGFDVELCRAVCDLLGWELKFCEVEDESKAFVHLYSGNADVVWGGMLLNPNESTYSVRCPYMSGGVVLVTLAGNGMGSIRKLAGATIGMNEAPKYREAFDKTELKTTAGVLAVSEEGSDVIFDRLYKGEYHAIVVDMAAANYYMR